MFSYTAGMSENTRKYASALALTSPGACSVTLTKGKSEITWEALPEGGQTVIVVPLGASVRVSAADAILTPVPFKAALGAGSGSIGGAFLSAAGEPLHEAELEETTAHITMRHATWAVLPQETETCIIRCEAAPDVAMQMQLIFAPAHSMSSPEVQAWLPGVDWLYGAPSMVAGMRYVITVTCACGQLKANATVWGEA